MSTTTNATKAQVEESIFGDDAKAEITGIAPTPAPTVVIPDPLVSDSPYPTTCEMLLTLTGPLSHHDPATAGESNTLLFNRQKQLLHRELATTTPSTQEEIDRITGRYTVASTIAPIVETVGYYAFVGVVLVRQFIDIYNSADGAGLFTGLERYSRLENRVRLAAVRSRSLRQFWDRLIDDMQVPIHGGERDGDLLTLFTVSHAAQESVLRALSQEYRSVVAVARFWHTATKQQSAAYAEKAGVEQSGASIALHFNADDLTADNATIEAIEVPAFQANGIRHRMVRTPGFYHLLHALGIRSAFPGEGDLPPGVEAIFENGGNIAAGAKQSGNPHGLAQQVRRTFPLLDLLGGCADSFDLGEGRLKPSIYLVCRENLGALMGTDAATLPNATASAFDMLDEVTQTRQASRQGRGQMIYNCEVLQPGTQFLVRFTLDGWTPDLTKGAFVAALDTYLATNPTIGGQSRAGFGAVNAEWLTEIDNAADLRATYESYLTENRAALHAAMIDGTLGASAQVVS